MPATPQTLVPLTLSNFFMTFAWYVHLKEMGDKPWFIAALVSRGIALFEYLPQVPANRVGFTVMSLPQLEILCRSGFPPCGDESRDYGGGFDTGRIRG
jgi:uncharacterized protein (DUF486 family)